MKHKALCLAFVIVNLTACATPRYQTVKCLTSEQLAELKKQEPEKVGEKLTGRADEDLRIVSGSAIRLRSWGLGLVGVLEGCSG